MRRITNVWLELDWTTILLYLILAGLGWINIYAAVYSDEHSSILDFSQRYGMQLIWIGLGLTMGFMILYLEVNFFTFFAYLIYGLSILLLIAAILFAKEINGARSWFSIGQFRIQPAEFAKIAVCLAVAKYLSALNIRIQNFRTLLISLALIVFPALFVLAEPDTGSALVYIAILFALYREGMSPVILLVGLLVIILFVLSLVMDKLYIVLALTIMALISFYMLRRKLREFLWASAILFGITGLILLINRLLHMGIAKYYLVLAGLVMSSLAYLILANRNKIKHAGFILLFLYGSVAFTYSVNYVFHNILEKHQQKRVNILLGIESDPKGAGYNVYQSKVAIGSGGFFGKGYLRGTQTKFNFVPEQSTDFIFCTVGEEWGFFGSTIILLLFSGLLMRLLFLAERQRSTFSRIYIYGVVSIFFAHIAINIGMTIGLLPVIGIPLPFFSYGGSSFLSFTLLLFIALRLDASRLEMLR